MDTTKSIFCMKYLFAFTLSLLLTACSTDNGIPDISQEGEYSIGFSALSNGNIGTRSVGDQTPASLSEMAVFAYMTTGNWTASATSNYMFNQAVTKSAGIWNYTPTKYWPAENSIEKVSFLAVSPLPSASNGITVNTTSATAGYPSFTITPPIDPSEQADFCMAKVMNTTYSDPDGNGIEGDNNDGKVPLTFNHVMTKVIFRACYTSSTNTDIFAWIDKITVSGVASSGNLQFTDGGFLFTQAEGNTGNYTLSLANGHLTGDSILKSGVEGEGIVSTTAGTLCLVPQTIPAGATITVVIDSGIAGTDIYTTSIPLSGTWEAGKQYTYNLSVSDMDVKLDLEESNIPHKWDIAYSGTAKTFMAPFSGTYKMECWGASSNPDATTKDGGSWWGRGGYAQREVQLVAGQKIYVYVGGKGSASVSGGWNGGGGILLNSSSYKNSSGGGATDIRTSISAALTGDSSTDPRLIVAGGGGGNAGDPGWGAPDIMRGERGDAGGLIAPICGGYFQRNVPTSSAATSGGTQTSGGVRMGFGNLGTNGIAGVGGAGSNGQKDNVAGGGGGGGWWGGAGGSIGAIQGGIYCNFWSSGAGGSSYVGDNGATVAGFESMVQPDGTTSIGHTGDGYARITLVR